MDLVTAFTGSDRHLLLCLQGEWDIVHQQLILPLPSLTELKRPNTPFIIPHSPLNQPVKSQGL